MLTSIYTYIMVKENTMENRIPFIINKSVASKQTRYFAKLKYRSGLLIL